MLPRRSTVLALAAVLAAATGLSGCSGSSTASANAADRTFLQEMIPHHQRALEIARIAEKAGSDARVRSFGATVLREQTPELTSMQKTASGMHLDYTSGARDADNRVTDPELAALQALHGAAFDRRYIQLNITSEMGAYAMARTELAHGDSAAAKKVAKGISYSPGQIHRLQALLLQLG